ncbi:hypothetical protein PVAP13_8KG214102 [Panicum virgatum]|uniref:Uncharacterized protein n=1 Tax=Panicum virgatum TaxID=38727 RepID=A0A8T0PF54_PANVG|nr:hypothetical protein PVAP13_8KG214102 [Panicum virgatum]
MFVTTSSSSSASLGFATSQLAGLSLSAGAATSAVVAPFPKRQLQASSPSSRLWSSNPVCCCCAFVDRVNVSLSSSEAGGGTSPASLAVAGAEPREVDLRPVSVSRAPLDWRRQPRWRVGASAEQVAGIPRRLRANGEKKKRVKRRNELDVVPYRQLKQSGVHCIS